MTEEQRKLCRDLVIFPNGQSRITKEDFLRRFPSAVERGRMALKWLQEAYETRNADDLSYVLIVGGNFGFVPEHKDILRRLIDEDWHYSHEDVVSALQTWPTADTVEALFRGRGQALVRFVLFACFFGFCFPSRPGPVSRSFASRCPALHSRSLDSPIQPVPQCS